jgi:hypothetical protein
MLAYLSSKVHEAFHPLFDPAATDAEKKAAADDEVPGGGARRTEIGLKPRSV